MKTVSMQDLVNVIDEKNETIKEEKTYSSGLEGIVREQKKAIEAQAKEIENWKKAITNILNEFENTNDADWWYMDVVEKYTEELTK